jgi:hypothetical protein
MSLKWHIQNIVIFNLYIIFPTCKIQYVASFIAYSLDQPAAGTDHRVSAPRAIRAIG